MHLIFTLPTIAKAVVDLRAVDGTTVVTSKVVTWKPRAPLEFEGAASCGTASGTKLAGPICFVLTVGAIAVAIV